MGISYSSGACFELQPSLLLVVALYLYVIHQLAGKVNPQVALLAAEHAPEMLLLSVGTKTL